ncbi:DUF6153 family protein [Streptomyces sp. T028]|uniref:DUF6153 family protein n=1 Tax=Streptomyces sp. T028 TaxID=3394379 RepID=UPI003A8B7D08
MAVQAALVWTRAAVIALFVALAVLVHHEVTAAPMPPTPSPSSAVHVMPGDMAMSGHTHGAAAGSCAGMAMQHCAPVSVDKVALVPPPDSSVPDDLAAQGAAVLGAVPAAAVGRAPPDLSVLSQLRI